MRRFLCYFRGGSTVHKIIVRSVFMVGCVMNLGCSRAFWRQQADKETYAIMADKTRETPANIPRLSVEPDPRSRFYDPYDPDQEPLPPDDPIAHKYMHWVSGKMGYKSWHELGTAFSIENPNWLESLGLPPETKSGDDGSPDSPLPSIQNLALGQAIELGNIHNRDYQRRIERLFLAALDLTFERFRFNVRYLGIAGRNPNASYTYETIPDGDNTLDFNSRFGVSQLLPTGAQWAVEMANNTLWLFTGTNQTTSATALSYSLVQPLLRGAGRKIVLENLTQSERNVLYETRLLARFRKEFFTSIVAGGSGQSGGFLGLLLQEQNILNQEGNIHRLDEQTEIQKVLASQKPEAIAEPLDALPAGIVFPPSLVNKLQYAQDQHLLFWHGEMSKKQEKEVLELSEDPAFQAAAKELVQRLRSETITLTVAQLETELAAARSRLRSAERVFQDNLDRFKIVLGLPTDMPVTLDLAMLKPFELIDSRLPPIEQKIKDFVEEWARLDDANPDVPGLRKVVAGLNELLQQVRVNGLQLIETDFDRAQELFETNTTDSDRPHRLRTFSSKEERTRVRKDVQNDRRLYSGLKNDFHEVEQELRELDDTLKREDLGLEERRTIVSRTADLREQLLKTSQSLQVIQIGLRVELIAVEPFQLSEERVVRLGLEQRLDLMNERASVMDARRKVEIAANKLEAVLDVVAEGDVKSSRTGKPFDFRGKNSSFRAGVAFTAPLDLITERNAYRAQLIAYQQTRRDYIGFEDNVKFEIRQRWRQLEVTRGNFELSRQRVRIAALQYDNAVEEANAPVQQKGGRSGALNLLQALDAVLAAQNNLIADWINYERNRIQIYRDMGIMQIDANGVWQDNYYQKRVYGHESGTGSIRQETVLREESDAVSSSATTAASVAPVRDLSGNRVGEHQHTGRIARLSSATGNDTIRIPAVRDGSSDAGPNAHDGDGTGRSREPDQRDAQE